MICGCEDQVKKIPTKEFPDVINFKVVVHLCFETHHLDFYKREVENAIDDLNKDFSGITPKNPYSLEKFKEQFNSYIGLSGDSKITFELSDIVHKPIPTQHSVNTVVLDTQIKSYSPAVSPLSTLNIWIADLKNIHGYAQYPWDLDKKPDSDGVVISKNVFGRGAIYEFSHNKTLTHMVGHWLGLAHVYCSDVIDLPKQKYPTYGNPLILKNSWPTSEEPHMYMNFMDFTDDFSKFMFTKGQIEKMRNSIHYYRRDLVKEEIPVIQKEVILKKLVPSTITLDDWDLKTKTDKMDAKNMRTAGISLKRYAFAETPCDLSGVTKATLTVSIKNATSNITFLFRTSDKLWQRTKVKNRTDDWDELNIPLPGPFGPEYIVRIQSSNINNFFTFKDVSIKNII